MPSQYVELLGFIVDLKADTFHVPPRRVDALKQLLDIIIAKDFCVSARTLSCMTGSLVSMSLAMGPVVRLWTRAMYRDISSAPCWDQPICLSSDSRSEVLFGNRTLTIVGIQSGHLAQKSRSCHILMLAVSVGEALLFTLMVNRLWEAGQRKRAAGALHSVS